MYQLNDSLFAVKGIGTQVHKSLASKNLQTILDLLLTLPIRYEDRSEIITIHQLKLQENSQLIAKTAPTETTQSKRSSVDSHPSDNPKIRKNLVTTHGIVQHYQQYYKGRLLISRATITDGSERLNCLWFNNKFLRERLKPGQEYYFSGEFKNQTLMQATVEDYKAETLHTGRLVPLYSQLGTLKQGSLRRILKEICDNLRQTPDPLASAWATLHHFPPHSLDQLLATLHFPQQAEDIVQAREFLAFEEIIFLIQQAQTLKKAWQSQKKAWSVSLSQPEIPELPFTLTSAQKQAFSEICQDLTTSVPMNRLLVGDVGSGKTIVAALAARQVISQGKNVCFVAPTKILAQQHVQTLTKLFPDLNIILVSSATKRQFQIAPQVSLYIGTHALLRVLPTLEPGLVIFDEQQRFGVKQRTIEEIYQTTTPAYWPHLLTMTATPIPRTMMLSIFAHLSMSYINQFPKNRQVATTWLIPAPKEQSALDWLAQQLIHQPQQRLKQAIVVCPFIDPSKQQALENVAAAEESFQALQQHLLAYYQAHHIPLSQQPQLGLLHSRLSKTDQARVIEQVFQEKIQLLITTPIVEVGVDLPNADIILIQAAERFGLASLHQLRGRVGRNGQESFCLLFTTHGDAATEANHQASKVVQQRLQRFCQEKDGLKLAQLDLENRGAGNIFGTQQSGFSQLRFASWTHQQLIADAQKIWQQYQIKGLPESVLLSYFQQQLQQPEKIAAN